MAFKYRQVKPADGDIIDPEDLNANNREFSNEFNGFLDRDNIDFQSLESKHCKKNAFNKLYSDFRNNSITVDGKDIDWHRNANTNEIINRVVFEADTDGVLICEWSGRWKFERSLSATNPDVDTVNLVTYRIVVQNNEVTRIHRSADAKKQNSGYMCGVFEVSAGINTIDVEAKIFKSKNTNSDKVVCDSSLEIFDRELVVNYRKR